MIIRPSWRSLDPFLIGVPAALLLLSTVFIFSLGIGVGGTLWQRELLFASIGLVVIVLMSWFDYRVLWSWIWPVVVLVAGLIVLTEIFGFEQFGAKLWIDLGIFQLQPGELVKIVAPIALARVLIPAQGRPSFWRFLTGVVVFLVFFGAVARNDFGTAAVIASVCMVVFFSLTKVPVQRFLLTIGLVGALSVVVLAAANRAPFGGLLKDYQRARLTSFIYPDRDPAGSGYNVQQARIAISSGGMLGKGIGFGTQSQLSFLPLPHTDFIYAVIAEGWGMAGSVLVLGLYAALIIRAGTVASRSPGIFGVTIALAIAVKWMTEVVINIGMNLGVLPVTGIPLPFLSYGGTALVVNAFCAGLIAAIAVRSLRSFDR
jgi:rod shape determining protein RodA